MGIKQFIITAAAFLFAAVIGISVLRSEADAFNNYITRVELTDLDNPKAKSYGPYDNMQIKWLNRGLISKQVTVWMSSCLRCLT